MLSWRFRTNEEYFLTKNFQKIENRSLERWFSYKWQLRKTGSFRYEKDGNGVISKAQKGLSS